MTKEQKDFIQQIAPIVQELAPEYDIAVCSPVIAQAILESGWGRSKLAKTYHNYFGMKAGSKWKGKAVNLTTSEEYTPGEHTVIKDDFRVYDNMRDGIRGYFEFIQLERYHNLRGITDPRQYLETIKSDGYATSSTYVSDLMRVIETYDLTRYDKQEATVQKGGGPYMPQFKSEKAAIDSMIATAEGEVGYLEKKSNSQLDSKKANAGSNNFTKYWRDIKPGWQGQYWCACFVSWVLMVTFGQAAAEKLLKHWPFLYCPTLAAKTTNKTPKRGAVILFWRPAKGRYGHTGIVYKVDATYVYTIEGNTSGGSSVIANGGGVVKKTYKRADLHAKTLYFMPDYSILVNSKTETAKSATTPATTANKSGSLIPGECAVTLKQFLPGAEHPQVKTIQRLLNALGYKGENGKALKVDGQLGEQTTHALAQYQAAKKLGIKSPGTVGAKTWEALLNEK